MRGSSPRHSGSRSRPAPAEAGDLCTVPRSRAALPETLTVPARRAIRPAPPRAAAVPDGDPLAARLQHAGRLAQGGDPAAARTLCAALLFAEQPRIAADPALRRQMAATLLHARGFQLLSRMIAALDGRVVRFTLSPPGAPAGRAAPVRRIGGADGSLVYVIDELLFVSAQRDALIARCSAELAG